MPRSEPLAIGSEPELIGLALALGARELGAFSGKERACAARALPASEHSVTASRAAIARGEDPLGDALCALRSARERRALGAVYTPRVLVDAMTAWCKARGPARVIDPGAGSGRFLIEAGRALPKAELIAIEIDPLASLVCRAQLAAAGLARRARVEAGDYRSVVLPRIRGRTAFVGNPPYVRHHEIDARWKRWLVATADSYGLRASQLAGLHVHFLLATVCHARVGDCGSFVTAAEWLDVNYGRLVRQLVLGALGGSSIDLIDPSALPFAGTATTAAVTCFECGSRPASLRLRRVDSLAALSAKAAKGARAAKAVLGRGRSIRRQRLEAAPRWTPLLRRARAAPAGYIELGELCRVHRGQATGANRIWIAGPHSDGLPADVLFPTVTKARELFASGASLADTRALRRVIDLPANLDALAADTRAAIERFLRRARALGADQSFIARHRSRWWCVGLRAPAAILATYMARRAPAFVHNLAGARHINIAHGLYPRAAMSEQMLRSLARYLAANTSLDDGRAYAGGLIKFEPKEMERLLVPNPELLASDELDGRWNHARARDRLRSHDRRELRTSAAHAGSSPA